MTNSLPLNGVRVIDLSWIIAGPTATRFLAAMGAEVIKIGSARRPDPSTRGAPFQVYNQSKMYCALNLSKPEGLDLVKELISVSDVVVENFAAGVIERIGLGYDVVSDIKPDVVMVSSSGTGHSGPDKDYVAYGSLLQYYTGWNSISGYPDREPIKGGLWADPWVGMELAMVTSAALNHRLMTGQGQYVDFSMAEALTASIPEALLDYQMNDRVKEPIGNDDDLLSPHGVFKSKGYDKWVAIAVTSESEWLSLCHVIGRHDLMADTELQDSAERRKRKDEIGDAITKWTSEREDYEAMRILQAAGIPSAPSLDVSRVYVEPNLREQNYFTTTKTSDGETRDLPGLPWRIEGGPEPDLQAAPTLGQDNVYVYQELLGISESESNRLIDQQIMF